MRLGLMDWFSACLTVLTTTGWRYFCVYELFALGISHLPYTDSIKIHRSEIDARRQVPFCSSEYSVCTSILKIDKGNYIEEGPLCQCVGCNSTWREEDTQSLTWYHHERGDWVIHFRFCEAVIARRRCRSEELSDVVAIVEGGSGEDWSPKLKYSRCQCHNHRFYMRGWMLVEGQWNYEFTCERPMCKKDEACMKHYMDKSGSHTMGYRFMCSCREGYHCPTGKGGKVKAYEVDADDSVGPYIQGYCQKIPGWDHVVEPVS